MNFAGFSSKVGPLSRAPPGAMVTCQDRCLPRVVVVESLDVAFVERAQGRRGSVIDERALERHLDSRGFITRVLGRVTRSPRAAPATVARQP